MSVVDLQKIRQAVAKLARYYGVVGRDRLTQALIQLDPGETAPSEQQIQDALASAQDSELANLLLNVTDNPELSGQFRTAENSPTAENSSRFYEDVDEALVNSQQGNIIINSKIKTRNLNVTTRGTAPLSLFMNCIPTVEMSRCVPFLNVMILSKKNTLDNRGRPQTISLAKYIHGDNEVPEGERGILSANDQEIDKLFSYQSSDGETQRDVKSVGGMELFTMPQTFSADRSDLSDNEVLDRYRPFMSITGLEVSEVSSGHGMISFKNAELTIILHDRSRLNQIADLVKPSLFGDVDLMIEYGWSHPEDDPDQNPYGTLINAVRVKDFFQVYGSKMSMNETGEMEINLSLSTRAQGLSNATNCLQNNENEILRGITQATNELSELLSSNQRYARSVEGMSTIYSAAEVESVLQFDEERIQEIRELVGGGASRRRGRRRRNNTGTSTLDDDVKQRVRDVLTQIETLRTSLGEGSGGLSDVFDRIEGSSDPFLSQDGENQITYGAGLNVTGPAVTGPVEGRNRAERQAFARQANKKIISLGKLLNYFVAEPLARTGKYAEVQVVFYPFNHKASYMHTHNVSEMFFFYDDNHRGVKQALRELSRNSAAQFSIQSFLRMLSSKFLHNLARNISYGFNGMYEVDDDGSTNLKDNYSESEQQGSERRRILGQAYPTGVAAEFVQPSIAIKMDEMVKQGENANDPPNRICRIHVYDRTCSANSTILDMLASARTDRLGTFGLVDDENDNNTQQLVQAANESGILRAVESSNTDNTEVRQYRVSANNSAIKDFITSRMPSIVYGSAASMLKSADIATEDDPSLATIQMLRNTTADGQSPQGAIDSGLPMQISPTSLSIDTVGCSLFEFGQEMFFDFGTGTTADNVYRVSEINHTIGPGEFDTSVSLVQVDAFGVYRSAVDRLQSVLNEIESSSEGE